MSVSPKLTQCPDIKFYFFLTAGNGYYNQPSKLCPGILVKLCSPKFTDIDYNGGTLKWYDIMAASFWVEILQIEDEHFVGRVSKDNDLFKVGSTIHFKLNDIISINGSREWNIENLTVLVSEKIIYQQEEVGYFVSSEMAPWSYSHIFYSRSEILEPKEKIRLVEIPLATLVSIDPVIFNYLDQEYTWGALRVDDYTFKELGREERDESIYPLGNCFDDGEPFEEDDWEEDD